MVLESIIAPIYTVHATKPKNRLKYSHICHDINKSVAIMIINHQGSCELDDPTLEENKE